MRYLTLLIPIGIMAFVIFNLHLDHRKIIQNLTKEEKLVLSSIYHGERFNIHSDVLWGLINKGIVRMEYYEYRTPRWMDTYLQTIKINTNFIDNVP